MGIITNIQHFSLHDGPGVRTVVFLKGCSLRCTWCHNPETWSMKPQLLYYAEKCTGCGACIVACPHGCHSESGFDRAKCHDCGACADQCHFGALTMIGETITPETCLRRIMESAAYFERGGGVTFSGGECMLQVEFLHETIVMCKANGLHTAIDTAGDVPRGAFERVLPHTDLFLYDIKAMDDATHRAITGVGNARILANLTWLRAQGCNIIVRVPYIPGMNDGEMPAIAAYLSEMGLNGELLPYHALGASKFAALNIAAPHIGATLKTDDTRLQILRKTYGFT